MHIICSKFYLGDLKTVGVWDTTFHQQIDRTHLLTIKMEIVKAIYKLEKNEKNVLI